MNISEKTQIRLTFGSLAIILIFIASSTFALGGWTNKMESVIIQNRTDIEENCNCIEENEDRLNDRDIQNATIITSLNYIETTLIEVKNAVHEME